ncbi:MAG: DUF3617 domain-containing protein [Candidatus Thiodiazotropha sp. (ex Troendleina suluensis)]|nr:DUF3617 domain-containing protein [Candidatus Thiodiazotropha sp. (ex Troendleina suluensis)]
MKIQTAAASLSLLILFSSISVASDVNMNPGLWKWTAVLDMPGMPMQLPPTSYTTCITKANFVPKDSKLGQTCETIDLKTEGDRVSWSITCTQQAGVTKSQGNITYHGDTAEGVIQVSVEGMQMNSKTTGIRLGHCEK